MKTKLKKHIACIVMTFLICFGMINNILVYGEKESVSIDDITIIEPEATDIYLSEMIITELDTSKDKYSRTKYAVEFVTPLPDEEIYISSNIIRLAKGMSKNTGVIKYLDLNVHNINSNFIDDASLNSINEMPIQSIGNPMLTNHANTFKTTPTQNNTMLFGYIMFIAGGALMVIKFWSIHRANKEIY